MPLFRPGKPYRVLTLSANPAAHASEALVTWDTVDEDGAFDVGTDMTSTVIEKPGLYSMTMCWDRSTPSTSSSVIAGVRLNGVTIARARSAATAGAQAASCTTKRQLVAGDVVTFAAQTGGTGNPIIAGCSATVVRQGPVRWT